MNEVDTTKPDNAVMIYEEKNGGDLTVAELHKGISNVQLTGEQAKSLKAPIKEEEIEIRPDGIVYPPQIMIRNRLNDILGPGKWAIMRRNISFDDKYNKVYFDGILYINGSFVSQAVGAAEWFPKNRKQDKASAAESAKSDCLVRCIKDLGMFSELWNPKFLRDWLPKNAIEVWCKTNEGSKLYWRLRSSPPIDIYNMKEFITKEEHDKQNKGKNKSEKKDELPIKNKLPQKTNPEKTDFLAKCENAYKWLTKKNAKQEYFNCIGGFGFEKAKEITDKKTQESVLKMLHDIMLNLKKKDTK